MIDLFLHNPFAEFSLIFLVVFFVSTIMRLLKQPFIVGFILTGIVFSPQLLGFAQVNNLIEVSALLGVTLLLFMAGLHLNPYYLKTDGKAIIFVGLGQIAITSVLGFFTATALGYEAMKAVYIAIALTLSSTIVTLKLLGDSKQMTRLHARLSIGILLLQDIFVAIALIVLNAMQAGQDVALSEIILNNLSKVILLAVPIIFLRQFVLNRLLAKIANNKEYLFTFVISWMLLFATMFELAGFSLEVGALFGGILLAPTLFSSEISATIKSLRDFFLIIFFINLGSNLTFSDFGLVWKKVVVLSGFVLVLKPFIVMMLLNLLGFKHKVATRTAFNLAHISEFSLILMALGSKAGIVSQDVSNVITLVALISIAVSTYLISYATWIIDKLSPLLKLYEWNAFKRKTKTTTKRDQKPEIVLVGAKATSDSIIKTLDDSDKNYLVIDYNPEMISELKQREIPCFFGDLENLASLEGINLEKTSFMISTVSDVKVNLTAIDYITKNYPDIHYLCYALDDNDALQLYENGVAYVLVPHHVGGKFVSTLIEGYSKSPEEFIKERLYHLRTLGN